MDNATGALTPPFIAYNDEEAKRMLAFTIHNAHGTPLKHYPEQFTLVSLCHWDDLEGVSDPIVIAIQNAAQIKVQYVPRMNSDQLPTIPDTPVEETPIDEN